jgi:hypothetical protein
MWVEQLHLTHGRSASAASGKGAEVALVLSGPGAEKYAFCSGVDANSVYSQVIWDALTAATMTRTRSRNSMASNRSGRSRSFPRC